MSETAKPTKLTELVPSNYLEAAEFDEERTVTITDWNVELVGPDHEPCGVLYFEEIDRGLILNKSKKKALFERWGNDLSELVGKQVTLFKTEVMAFGSMRPAIGMRIPK